LKDGRRMKRPGVKKIEVRVWLDRPELRKIDECVRRGDMGTSRSEVIRFILKEWARGKL